MGTDPRSILTIIGKIYEINTKASRPEQEAFWSKFAETHGALLLDEVQALPPLHAEIMQDYYGLAGATTSSWKILGERAGLSAQRVHDVHDEAIDYLQLSLQLVTMAEALAQAGLNSAQIQEQMERKRCLALLNTKREIPLFEDTYDWLKQFQPDVLKLSLKLVRHLLSPRTRYSLFTGYRASEATFGDILDQTAQELQKNSRFGKKIDQEVLGVLASFNLYLRR